MDYDLFVDGQCVGLIEAKRQSTDVPGVLGQTRRYALDLTVDPERIAPGAQYRQETEIAVKCSSGYYDARTRCHLGSAG